VQHGLLSVSSSPARTGEAERRPIAYNVFGKNCIVFALKDNLGQITGLYFRSIIENRNRKDATTRHFYLRDRKGLYPNYPPHYAEKLILTESIIDAASLLQNTQISHEYSILALYGTNGLTDEHQKAIKSIKNLEEIILFFDGDQAGREAVKKYAPMLKAGGEPQMVSQAKVSVANCPESEDINSLLISHESTVLEHILETRTSFIFSIEKEKVPEIQLAVGVPIEPQKTESSTSINLANPNSDGVASDNVLDTSNPFNLIYRTEAITYCIKGGIKGNLDSLKISVQIINNQNKSDYRAKLDLYENKQIVITAQATAEKLHLNHNQIESDLGVLTSLLEDYRDSQEPVNENAESKVKVSESNTRACVNFLQQEKLLSRFNDLLGESGIIGEENNRLLLFVIASSYMMPSPLHALVQGSSGSGKTHLLLKIANLMPQEDTITLTRVTESSRFGGPILQLRRKRP
jgi:DNA primase